MKIHMKNTHVLLSVPDDRVLSMELWGNWGRKLDWVCRYGIVGLLQETWVCRYWIVGLLEETRWSCGVIGERDLNDFKISSSQIIAGVNYKNCQKTYTHKSASKAKCPAKILVPFDNTAKCICFSIIKTNKKIKVTYIIDNLALHL